MIGINLARLRYINISQLNLGMMIVGLNWFSQYLSMLSPKDVVSLRLARI